MKSVLISGASVAGPALAEAPFLSLALATTPQLCIVYTVVEDKNVLDDLRGHSACRCGLPRRSTGSKKTAAGESRCAVEDYT